MKKVSVIGLGYVGLGIAVFASQKNKVIGLEINEKKVEILKNGNSYIEGIESKIVKEAIQSGNFHPTSNPVDLEGSEIVVICVPTPLNLMREPDLTLINAACDFISDNLFSPALIINESTSYPGTLRNHIKSRIEAKSSVKHEYSSSPERVDPGNKNWTLKNTPRLLSGLTEAATKNAFSFYSSFAENIVTVSTPEVAEMAKLFENTFRQVNIALVNEMAIICNSFNLNVYEVLNAADTKPYGFMKFNPGPGVGGHCIPVDPSYLAYSAGIKGASARFIELANKVNLDMPAYIIQRCKKLVGNLSGKKILICGVAYKSNIADTRETPASSLFDQLIRDNAEVYWHDPLVENWKENKISKLSDEIFDLTIVQVLHDSIDLKSIYHNSKVIFDCTGKISGVAHL